MFCNLIIKQWQSGKAQSNENEAIALDRFFFFNKHSINSEPCISHFEYIMNVLKDKLDDLH